MSKSLSVDLADHPINNLPSDEAQDHLQAQADADTTRTTDSRTCTKEARNNNTSMNLDPPTSDINLSDPSADQNELNGAEQSHLPNRSVEHENGEVEVEVDKAADAAIIDTTTTSTTSTTAAGKANAENPDSVAPPSIVRRPRENIDSPIQSQHSTNTNTTHIPSADQLPTTLESIASISTAPPRSTNHTTSSATTSPEDKMLFGRKAAARRRVLAKSNALTEYEADLTSKDRTKQKEAVRKYLDEHIKTDWKWDWPPKTSESADAEETPIEGTITIDEEWRERDEWESNVSESDEDPTSPKGPVNINSPEKESAFRFDSPDGVGACIQKQAADRKRRRKKRLAEEMKWNDGARCFVARRDAWTCARQVPPSSKRPSRVKTNQTITSVAEDGSSTAADDEYSSDEEWDTEIPIAGPLLPPDNAMRASITPAAYGMIYDKVIVQALTPSCPMNLRDVTRSCVQGWKRDGEWPPRASVVEQAAVVKKRNQRRLSLANILGLDRSPSTPTDARLDLAAAMGGTGGAGTESPALKSPTTPGGSIKKGLQKILSFGHDSTGGKKS
ncbi:hypothetical protein ACMFMG_006339 [Clarireedia jacksonii]